jgi:hypothetical protein
MSDDLVMQSIARSLAARLRLLSLRDLQLVDEVVIRLCQRASESPRSRVAREAIDDLIDGVGVALDQQDRERAEVREAARVEMLGYADALDQTDAQLRRTARDHGMELDRAATRTIGDAAPASEWAPDQLTRVSPDSAVIALGDERARDPELEVDVELDSDPGDEWDVRDVGGRA